MKKIVALGAFALCITTVSKAQTAVDSVKMTIDNMFRAMKTADSALLRQCFADSAIMQTIAKDRTGAIVVKNESATDFIRLIGTLAKNAADERITYDVVRVDGPLATAWTSYKFYLNGQFSHCGVNSFQLVRIRGAWKIQYIIDTRRKQPCE
jgi:predicted YcjX-like family ATPase